MTITAKFASTCTTCHRPVSIGARVEWVKGVSGVRHTDCAVSTGAPASSRRARGKNWDPSRFNGYGAKKGGYVKACVTGGNCSSFGSGRSCGGHDCDGY